MGKYSCPACDEPVRPLGTIDGWDADGFPIQRKRCPACGQWLQRVLLDRWHAIDPESSEHASPHWRDDQQVPAGSW